MTSDPFYQEDETPLMRAQNKFRSRPKPKTYRPNIRKQALFVCMAIAGIAIGYGIGFIAKPSSPIDAQVQQPGQVAQAPEQQRHPEDKVFVYEEPLPGDIVEGKPLKYLSVTNIFNPDDYTDEGDTEATRNNASNETNNSLGGLPAAFPHSKNSTIDPNQTTGRQQVSITDIENIEQRSNQTVAERPKLSVPVWKQNAIKYKLIANKPRIAIVIDDVGIDRNRSKRVVNLTSPLTLAYLAYTTDLQKQADNAVKAGHELMLHVPMEPKNQNLDPGPNVLLQGLPRSEIRANLISGLSLYDKFIGINNHMGSRFTSDLEGMNVVMELLQEKEMIFLDSVTTPHSKGKIAAQRYGVPFIRRNIFIDHEDDMEKIKNQLQRVEKLALKQGYAIAIGHPREKTIVALEPWLKEVASRGFQLVPLSSLIFEKYSDGKN